MTMKMKVIIKVGKIKILERFKDLMYPMETSKKNKHIIGQSVKETT